MKGIGRERLVKLLISGPGIATSRVYARTRGGDVIEFSMEVRSPTLRKIVYHPASFTHVAGPSQAVEGVVRDAKTKQSLSGVTLKSYQLAGHRMAGWTEAIVRTVTDDKGHFRLEGLPIGRNEVLCLSSLNEPYIVTKFRAETTAGKKAAKKDLELTRGLWIEGRVYDKNSGKPIRSGRVNYFAFTNNPFAQAVKGFNGAQLSTRYRLKPDGTYRIPGLPGRGIVAIMAMRDHEKYPRGMGADKIKDHGKVAGLSRFDTFPYWAISSNYHVLMEVNPEEGEESVQLDFPFDAGQTLTVQVVDSDGKPVSGGMYSGLMEFASWRPFRDDRLTINSYQPNKPWRVQVFHKERKLAGLVVIKDKNPRNLRIKLQPWGEIKGRLLDMAGAPKESAWINNVFRQVRSDPTMALLPPNQKYFSGQRGFLTDQDGRFSIVGLVPNTRHSLSATESRKNGMLYDLGAIAADLTLKPGEVRDLGDVRLKRNRGK